MPTALIGIDWGTTRLRGFRIGGEGALLERRESALGISQIREGAFDQALCALIADWQPKRGSTPILMCGMIGSRQGWKEAPYAHCPAGAAEIAAGMIEVRWGRGRRAWIAPGLTCRDATGVPDVMRGEEVQILGTLDRLAPTGTTWICLPGTHSKWAKVEGGRIVEFATYMTGEVFAVMKAHSILGRMMAEAAVDLEAFDAGVRRAREPGGLLHHLFGVRTRGLFGDLTDDRSAAYLSGLMIGHEIASVPWLAGSVHILGAEQLGTLYVVALRCFGIEASRLDADAAVGGLYRLARTLPNH